MRISLFRLVLAFWVSLAGAALCPAATFTFAPSCSNDWNTVCDLSNGACGPDHLFGNNWGWVDSQCRGAYTNNGVFPSITDDVILGTNTVGIDGFGSGSAHDMSIAAGGVLNHAGSMNLTGTFTNGGSVIFNGAGSHHSGTYLNNNSMVDPEFGRNRTGHDFTLINNGLFELSGSDWSNGSGSCAIVNNGELRKVQDTWFAPMNGFDVTNNGQINVNGGTLRFRPTQAHGCRFESTPSAEYTIDAAGTLDFITGASNGQLQFVGTFNGTNNGRMAVGVGAFDAVIAAPGATFNIGGNGLRWEGATMTVPGSSVMTNAATGLFIFHGSASISGAVHNLGHMIFQENPFSANLSDATITNDGNFEIRQESFAGQGDSHFINNAAINKTAATHTNIDNITFQNNGAVNIDAGTIRFRFGDLSSGNAASYHVAEGARLDFHGNGGDRMHLTGTFNCSVEGSMGTVGEVLNIDAPGATFNATGNGMRWEGQSIEVAAGATLTNAATGKIEMVSDVPMSGEIHNLGTFVQSEGTFGSNCNGVSFINDGTMELMKGAWIDNTGTNLLRNNATIRKTTENYVPIRIPIENEGLIEIQGGCLGVQSTFAQLAGVTRLNGGSLCVEAGGTATFAGGRLEGSGDTNNVNIDGATVAPGLSAGNLHVAGSYSQTAAATLEIELGGLTAGAEHDRLQVDGTATLDGTLSVELIDGFEPEAGQSFVILTAQTVTGTFASVNCSELYAIQYNPTDVTVTINFTPGDGAADCNDNDNENDNANTNNNENDNTDGSPPGTTPECGQDPCGPGAATAMMLMLTLWLASGRRRLGRKFDRRRHA